MRRQRTNLKRKIFIGVEGASEQRFVRLLQRWCDERHNHLYLKVVRGTGGDSVAVVRYAVKKLSRTPAEQEFETKLILLDSDRSEDDRRSGRDAEIVARRHGFEIIWQRPNLEGVLLRMHPGWEEKQSARQKLADVWPEYRKPPTAYDLGRRFKLQDLQRAAEHDPHLKRLITILDLQ